MTPPDDNQPGWGRPTDPWGRPLPDQPPSPPADGTQADAPPASGLPAAGPPTSGPPTSGLPANRDDWWGDTTPEQGGPTAPADPQRTPPQAIWALVASIAGFVTCGIFLGPLGTWLGFKARNRIDQTGSPGRGLATAAIVLGIIAFVLNLVVLVAVLTNPEFLNDLEGAPQ